MRKTLGERGALTIRGVAQVFKSMDKNKNKTIDATELEAGLRNFGLNLNDQ